MVELTEAMIDAPRAFLRGLELNIIDLEAMREHMARSGASVESWPDFAKTDTGYITKAAKAMIVFSMMMAARESE